ncbi:MAG TPA: MoxR family ATPase [Negativicutes bacterium]|nr:MoxR family ATPase [Negativicutes bacterium]
MTKERQIVQRIVENIEQVIVDKHDAISLVMIAMLCEGHVLIEDMPGVGKTSLVLSMVRSISAEGKRIQFTPDTTPSDIIGVSIFNQKTMDFEFRPGACMCNILLADEINRTSPRTQAALLEVMEERRVTVDGNTIPLPSPFMVLATQNPLEHAGTYLLPEAQLDRFFLRISMGYPSLEGERLMLKRFLLQSPLEKLLPVVTTDDVLAASQAVLEVFVDPDVIGYVTDVVSETRRNPLLSAGASPRASLALLKAARAHAFMAGRDFVLPDDVKAMAGPVLEHRLSLSQDGKLKGLRPAEVIAMILKSVKVPVLRHV